MSEPTTTTWQKSACILCECNCGIEVQVEDRRLVRIRGDKSHPSSEGYTCEKPLRLDRYQNGTARLTSPLRRRPDGSYEEIDWDTAVREIAERLQAIQREHGGDKIFFYGGGGQGNHLGATYNTALQAAVGARYKSNALAQEKTGEFFVDGKMYGGHTKGDFEHAEVVVFVGKNPWQSHSFPRARPVLKEMAADPARTMVVIDPRRSETAAMADVHLQVRPGTDAWCLAALGAVLVQEDLVDHEFVLDHTTGADAVLAAYREVDVTAYAASCGVPEELIRSTARRIGTASSVCTYEDLGIQQAPHSTLSSYLNKMLWVLTGNFAKPGAMFLHSSFVALAGGSGPLDAKPPRGHRRPPTPLQRAARSGAGLAGRVAVELPAFLPAAITDVLGGRLAPVVARTANPAPRPAAAAAPREAAGRRTPVTGARIISGLVPCNSIAEEILTDHPDRFRAMWIDSVNPAHSLADSASFRRAMRALDLTVVIDIAMTETAREADYVLPAATQFEKFECTFFNVDFPRNVFHLRRPLMDPLPGTLDEPEIYARVIRELGTVDDAVLAPLRRAARRGRSQFTLAFFAAVGANPRLMPLAPYLLHETLGPTLGDARGAASLWGAAQLCAMANPESAGRAGFTGAGFAPGNRLFDRILTGEGVVFTVDDYDNAWDYVRRPDRRFTLEVPELLERMQALATEPSSWTSDEFPYVLSAGERRAFTANTIIRDPSWRRRDAQGALRISPADAATLGVETGGSLRVVTEKGAAVAQVEVTDQMQPGHLSLPNGLGVEHAAGSPGVAPNDLTSLHHRDWLAGTPWHKYVPARLERV